jgi:hypothetical protein
MPQRTVKQCNACAFRNEAQLVQKILTHFDGGATPWGPLESVTEWDYRTGITDILVRTTSREIIAFEAKLLNWRRALYQAYRNTSFAFKAYVALPEAVAVRAQRYAEHFTRLGVGLCSCGVSGVSILIDAQRGDEPLMEWLTNRAHSTFDGARDARTSRHRQGRRRRLRAA